MYARSTTFAGDPNRFADAVAFVRQEMHPTLRDTEGFVGLSFMTDPRSGRCIATTAWGNEHTMRTSEHKELPLRERAAELLDALPQLDLWDIAVLHRASGAEEGAVVRATWSRVDPSRVEASVEMFRVALLPAIEQLGGFVSASLFVDRPSGRAVTCVTFDSQESLEQSRAGAVELRRAAVHENDVQILQVTEFDLSVGLLRVPETV